MNMQLIKLELTMLIRERRVLWLLLGVAALILLSFMLVALETANANAAKYSTARAERERWLNQDQKDPHSAAHHSIYAFKPAPALATLDPGIEPFVGQSVWLEAHAQNDMLHRPKGEAGSLQRAGLVNPAALLATLAPVVAFVLAFIVVARDRERGTLRLALGAALRPRQILAAKAWVIWGAMVGVAVIPLALFASGLAIWQGSFDADAALRSIAWTLTMSAYLGLLTLLGIAIAAALTDVRMSLAALFGLWILLSIALPRALTNVVEIARPLPQTQAIKQELQGDAPAYWSAEISQARQQELLARYGVMRKEDLPIDERGAQLDAAERHSHQVFDRVLGGFYDQVEGQDALFAKLAIVSPTAAVQSLSQTFAGTDFTHHRQFIDQAERYRRDLVNRMNTEVMNHPLGEAGNRYLGDHALWASIAPFSYAVPSLTTSWHNSAAALPALLFWLASASLGYGLATRGLRP